MVVHTGTPPRIVGGAVMIQIFAELG